MRTTTGLRSVGCGLAALAALSCGSGASPTGVATNPPGPPDIPASPPGLPTPSPSPPQTSGPRTVLSPLGINIHAADSLTAPVVGTAGRGTLLTVLTYTDRNQGWYRVRGATVTGWISADPDFSASGRFYSYRSSSQAFAALYPQTWTFSERDTETVFRPQSGPESIVVRTAASIAALGPVGRAGYGAAGSREVVVCGVTAPLVEYVRGATPPAAAASPGAPAALDRLTQVRLDLDSGHALELDYNHPASGSSQPFRNFYNSVSFPDARCEKPAPSPSPAATPPV